MSLDDFGAIYGGFEFPFPKIAGTYNGKRLVICGDGHSVWNDLERFGCKSASGRGAVTRCGWQFMTVNKLVEVFPGSIEHAYSNEAESLIAFVSARRREYRLEFTGPEHLHSCSRPVKHRWPWRGSGTSALGACLTAIALGYEEIVLAGIPLDDGPHNGEPHWRKCQFNSRDAQGTKENKSINHHWKAARDLAFDGRIKSLSGRTREWLGEP
jgi:hypothetical protein